MPAVARATHQTERRVAAMRRFSRFYTRRIGVLQARFLDSPFSLAEARVLYELTRRDKATASEIGAELGLDAGYLSRILRGFAGRGLVAKERSRADGRHILLTLTARGRKAFAPLEAYSNDEVAKMLQGLSASDQARLIAATHTIEELVGGSAKSSSPYVLRPHRPGDMGWVVSRHGAVYAEEYGWDERLEALAAEIVAAFLRDFDPARERCWIAERDGENVGCVFLVKDSLRVARLRLLLVDRAARGLGLGARLVDECIRFARQAGYAKITLWTHSVLTAARHVYQSAGFQLVDTKSHEEFGKQLVGETWDLKL